MSRANPPFHCGRRAKFFSAIGRLVIRADRSSTRVCRGTLHPAARSCARDPAAIGIVSRAVHAKVYASRHHDGGLSAIGIAWPVFPGVFSARAGRQLVRRSFCEKSTGVPRPTAIERFWRNRRCVVNLPLFFAGFGRLPWEPQRQWRARILLPQRLNCGVHGGSGRQAIVHQKFTGGRGHQAADGPS